ncbi:twin-arginine translocase TatA/TatE family subunit [Tessaracoccus antarcticus]|uniref:Sec-independent protein translocase protein TatA n=1 Tax=Tessaracoccus antarcticus TaxID=2479848 RepID=A0A3M0G4F6_9ACTN|nr:twin-arginine translocase TatA/TatE family subunit [Tessaracoccus antarcticus]RMB58987.1 twin-arginine translocase TatA/TatE family subunit [Tessaracoccus antarcticus]
MPGPTELLIILGIALLLFGGSRLAGLGKGVGRSIREFKTEVKAVDGDKDPEVVDAEIVQPETRPETEQERRIREIEARERDLNARETAAREAARQHDLGTGI